MKYLKVSVARKEYTDLYIAVPDDFEKNRIFSATYAQSVGKIAQETTDDFDWDDFGWEDDVEVDSVEEVTEEEANKYQTGQLTTVK